MRIREREAGSAVVKYTRGPGGYRVAARAGRCRRWETGRDVIRHRAANGHGAIKILLVAPVTIRRIERVVVVHMAGGAGSGRRGHVCSGQGKPGNAVIERCHSPACCRMASGTVRRRKSRSGSRVDRCIGLLPGRQMALRVPAIRRSDRQSIVVVDVAQIAGHVGVPIGEQESRGAVVERCCRPADRRVARRAVRKCKCRTGRWMDGICGVLPSHQMALRVPAIGRSNRQIIVVTNMTEGAGHIRMAIGQQEPGRTMVELGVQPIVKRMTGFASRRELCGNMVGISGFLKIPDVARLACGRKPQVITDGGVLMALIAFHGSMRAEQRKSVEVLLNRLD